MNDRKKLFKVTLKGMTYNSTGIAYGVSYAIAVTADEAYDKVRRFLDEKDLGFYRDRELDKIELIADSFEYTNIECLLYL